LAACRVPQFQAPPEKGADGAVKDVCSGRAIPADVLAADSLADTQVSFSTVLPGTEIRLRVRYVGTDPAGARFQACMIGSDSLFPARFRRLVLPIDSVVAIVA
jgi:hypothetical protein